MVQQILTPNRIVSSVNASSDNYFSLIQDPTDIHTNGITSADPSESWNTRVGLESPLSIVTSDIILRINVDVLNIATSVMVYQNDVIISNSLASPVNGYNEYILDYRLLNDPSGENLSVQFNGGRDYDFMFATTLYAVDMIVENSVNTVVNPDVPTDLLPINGYTTSSSIDFSATLNDAEDVYLNDTVALVVEYSQDQTFATGVTTKVSEYVTPSSNVVVNSNTISNGVWYWRAYAQDSGNLTSSLTDVRMFIIDNSPPTISNMTPANNIIVTSQSQTISAKVTDANGDMVQAEFQVADNLSFTSPTVFNTTPSVSDTVFEKSVTFSAGNNYWRVRAKDSYNNYSAWSSPYGIFVNASGVVDYSPNTIISQTNLAGVTVANISDNPDSPDATFATATSDTSASSIVVGFPTPSRALKTGVGLQTFKIWVKRSNATSTAIPNVTVSLLEDGITKATSANIGVNTDTGVIASLVWDASLITNINNVELQVNGTVAGSGKTRTSISIGAIGWNATLTDAVQTPAPTNGTVSNITGLSPTELTSNSITLSWTNPTDSDFSHVEIYRNNVLIKNNHTVTSYIDFNLSQNTSYTYKVVAVDVTGNKASGITLTATTLTGVSSNLPAITVTNISQTKISDEVGKNQSIITIRFSTDVTQYIARLNGVDQNTGVLVHLGGTVSANTDTDIVIDWNESLSEGQNRINIYGQNADGWTPYN